MIRHVDCNCILGATEEDVDKLFPDGSCIGYCPNKDCSRGLFGTDQGNGTYDDALAVAESRSRFKDEAMKALDGMRKKGPGGHGTCCVCQTCKFPNEECMCSYNEALQECIETINKL